MRAILVRPGPNFSVQDVAEGWISGLTACGVDTLDFDFGGIMSFYEKALRTSDIYDTNGQQAASLTARSLRAACFDLVPDVVVIISSFFVPPDTYRLLRARGIKVVTVFTESPYEDDNQIKIAPFADLCLVNDPQNLDRFTDANPNSMYVPHAYDPDRHSPGPAIDAMRSEFCFVGTGYPSRQTFFEQVDFDGVDVALAGNWSDLPESSPLHKFVAHDIEYCFENSDAVDLYRSTEISANIYRTEAQSAALSEGWAMGPREVELAACGTFYLTQQRGENQTVLPMVPTFDSPQDLSEAIRYWLPRTSEREQIAADARGAIADRTFTAHAHKLLAHL